jgi:hypothetical protein
MVDENKNGEYTRMKKDDLSETFSCLEFFIGNFIFFQTNEISIITLGFWGFGVLGFRV